MKKATPQTKAHLGGVPVATTIKELANSRVAEKAVDRGFLAAGRTITVVLVTGLVVAGAVFGPKLYRNIRRKSYAKKNLGDPNVQAAIIIRKAFTKLEFPSILSWVLPDVHLWTNQNELFKIARKVTDLDTVSKAYTILFDSLLMDDLKNGFSSSEFKKFFEIIQGKEGNPEPMKVIPIGKKVYSAVKSPMTIYQAVWSPTQKKWLQTNKHWKTVSYNQEIGEVYRIEKYSPQSRYYIIDGGMFKSGYGLVWDNKIKEHLD